MSEYVKVGRDGAVLVVTLARPEKKNALTGAMYEALIVAFAQASEEAEVGALLIEGSGGVFSAGNDIGDFLAYATAPGSAMSDAPVTRFIYALARFAKPLVAAIDGQAVGLGATLCFHCDLVYASPNARFHMPFIDLGLVPEAASSLLAPQRFGRARASEYLLLGEPFDAEAARAGGLVNAVVAARLGEGGDQRFVHRAGQRVFLLRPRQRDDDDAGFAADLNMLAHAPSARIAAPLSSGAAPD